MERVSFLHQERHHGERTPPGGSCRGNLGRRKGRQISPLPSRQCYSSSNHQFRQKQGEENYALDVQSFLYSFYGAAPAITPGDVSEGKMQCSGRYSVQSLPPLSFLWAGPISGQISLSPSQRSSGPAYSPNAQLELAQLEETVQKFFTKVLTQSCQHTYKSWKERYLKFCEQAQLSPLSLKQMFVCVISGCQRPKILYHKGVFVCGLSLTNSSQASGLVWSGDVQVGVCSEGYRGRKGGWIKGKASHYPIYLIKTEVGVG